MPFTNRLRLAFVAAIILSGCSKSLTHSSPSSSVYTIDASASPFYGDSILYVQGSGRSAYLFKPVNALAGGTFVSWPKGLTIDPVTGEIDILRSEPGARYNVGFVSALTGDTAYRQVILAGITYPDGIYDVSTGNTGLQPYFNANAATPGAANSHFDEEGIAGSQKLIVNAQTGAIDLQASVKAGLFGSQPHNGDSRDVSVYYRLNDQSHMSLLRTTITVSYYQTFADVPQALIEACRFSASAFRQTAYRHGELTEGTGGGTSPSPTSGGSTPVSKSAPPPPPPAPARPPQVIIVNTGHH